MQCIGRIKHRRGFTRVSRNAYEEWLVGQTLFLTRTVGALKRKKKESGLRD